jgi:hypothetical protein
MDSAGLDWTPAHFYQHMNDFLISRNGEHIFSKNGKTGTAHRAIF